jgi:hypothetical protein
MIQSSLIRSAFLQRASKPRLHSVYPNQSYTNSKIVDSFIVFKWTKGSHFRDV